MAGLFCDQAAEEILLVVAGHGNQKVGGGDAGFEQGAVAHSVAENAHGVEIVRNSLQLFRTLIDHDNVVVFIVQLFYEGVAHLAAAHNNNIHFEKLLSNDVVNLLPGYYNT